MTPLERLRLAAALGHTVPGAEFRLHTDRGESIVVGRHPTADIDPCAMRRVVAASACPGHRDHSQRVVDVSVGGALTDIGGGVYASRFAGCEQRWVASLLEPQCLADLLDDVGLDAVPDEAMHACIKPDSGLGVTILTIAANDARYHHALDEIAAQAAAACFVEELRRGAAELAHSNDLTGGAS